LKNNQSTGCLIIHGFGGNADEVSPLASRLKAQGYKVACPGLKGHTGRRSDLKRVGYTDWIKSAECGLVELMPDCRCVFIIGFSMGGLIAVNLALKYDIAGMVTINTPIHYWDIRMILSNIVRGLAGRDFGIIKRYSRAIVKFPVSALWNFRMLLNRTKPMLSDVVCPVLITQGVDDDTVRKSSAEYIFDNVNSQVKQLEFYENSGHLMLHGPAARDVIRDIEDFMGGAS